MGDHDIWPGRGLPPSGDPGHSPEGFTRPQDRGYANEDAARMGLDRNTLEGAQLHFFSHLSPTKPSHKLVAWIALFLMFGLPVLLTVMNAFRT